MTKATKISPQEIIVGQEYNFYGNIYNGWNADGTRYICKDNVTRKVVSINYEQNVINCICSRQFIIDSELVITQYNYN